MFSSFAAPTGDRKPCRKFTQPNQLFAWQSASCWENLRWIPVYRISDIDLHIRTLTGRGGGTSKEENVGDDNMLKYTNLSGQIISSVDWLPVDRSYSLLFLTANTSQSFSPFWCRIFWFFLCVPFWMYSNPTTILIHPPLPATGIQHGCIPHAIPTCGTTTSFMAPPCRSSRSHSFESPARECEADSSIEWSTTLWVVVFGLPKRSTLWDEQIHQVRKQPLLEASWPVSTNPTDITPCSPY